MRRRRHFVAVLCAGAFVSTGQAQTPAALDTIGRAIAAERCARPVEVKVSFVRNPQAADVADEMQSIVCRGFRVAIYRSLSPLPARELPMELVIEGTHPRVDVAWSVGASPAQVQAALGAPQTTRGASFGYELDGARPGRDRLEFEVRDGIVRAITWSWEVD